MSADQQVIHTNMPMPTEAQVAMYKLEKQREMNRERQRRYYARKKKKEAEQSEQLEQLHQTISAWEPQIAFLDWIKEKYPEDYQDLHNEYIEQTEDENNVETSETS